MKPCERDDVIVFDGYVVYGNNIPWWMGIDEAGLKSFIDDWKDREADLMSFEIYKGGEFVGTVGEYIGK